MQSIGPAQRKGRPSALRLLLTQVALCAECCGLLKITSLL